MMCALQWQIELIQCSFHTDLVWKGLYDSKQSLDVYMTRTKGIASTT